MLPWLHGCSTRNLSFIGTIVSQLTTLNSWTAGGPGELKLQTRNIYRFQKLRLTLHYGHRQFWAEFKIWNGM